MSQNQPQNPREHWKQIEDQVHNTVIQKGLISASLWGSAGLSVHLLLTKYNNRYRKHTFPFKLFVLLMIPTAAFFTTTDIAAMEQDRLFAQQYSISKPSPFSNNEQTRKLGQGWKEYVRENQFKLVGYTWLGLVTSTLAYNFSKPAITMQQKFINARMVSQAGALVGICAIALLHLKREEKVPGKVEDDLHFEKIVKK